MFAFGEFLNKRATYEDFLLNLKAPKEKACKTLTQVLEILTCVGWSNGKKKRKLLQKTQVYTSSNQREVYVTLRRLTTPLAKAF